MSTDRHIEALAGHLARPRPAVPGPLPGDLSPLSGPLLSHCLQHGLAPLVYRNLKASGLEEGLDEKARKAFKLAYYHTLASNLARFRDLREIAQAAREGGFPAIVLKGPALIHRVYGDPGLRPATDLDLLLRPWDLPRVREALSGLGYASVPRYPDLYRRATTVVDLHTDPLNRSRIQGRGRAVRLDLDALWHCAEPFPDFLPLETLCPVDQVITGAVHALKHGFQQKIWLVDLVELLSKMDPETEGIALLDACRETGTTPIVSLSLHAIREELGREIPPAGRSLACPVPAFLRRLARVASRPGMPQVLEPLVLFRRIPGVRQKLSYLLETAFPRPPILSQISGLEGRWTFWLSYPYRAAQLSGMALEYALHLGRTMRSSGR